MAASHHARAVLALAHRVECVAAYGPTAGRRRAFRREFGIPTVGGPDEIFEDPSIRAVLILTPPNTWNSFAAAEARKHILLEKPLDVSLERRSYPWREA